MMILALLLAAALPVAGDVIPDAFAGRDGALVLVDCVAGETQRHQPKLCAATFAPCSTFKIWNTAIGLETGLLTGADQPFWKWDGVSRETAGGAWNHDLTLRQAFAVSCVPAFQALARQIGAARMDDWLKKLGYGDRNTSSGLDVFWLPAAGRAPLLISADEQAELLRRLAIGDVPFSDKTQAILRDIMIAKTTPRGTLFGKTGSSGAVEGQSIGWFAGYVVSGKTTVAFACLLRGDGVMGKDARAVVEQVLAAQGLL